MLYTVSEVAKEIRVSEKTVRRMIDAGHLEIKRFGNLIRISQDELNRILNYGIPIQRKVSSEYHLEVPGRRARKEERLWV